MIRILLLCCFLQEIYSKKFDGTAVYLKQQMLIRALEYMLFNQEVTLGSGAHVKERPEINLRLT